MCAALEGMCEGDAMEMQATLAAGTPSSVVVDGVTYDIHPGMVVIKKEMKKQAGRCVCGGLLWRGMTMNKEG